MAAICSSAGSISAEVVFATFDLANMADTSRKMVRAPWSFSGSTARPLSVNTQTPRFDASKNPPLER
jgi:hypothetical protein